MDRNRLMKLVPPDEYRHPRVFALVRIAAGVWLLVLAVILYGYGRGGWWGVLLVPTAALLFYLAYRLPRAISARRRRRTKGRHHDQDVQQFRPPEATPVGHAGTRVEIHERPAWAINGWVGVLVSAACIAATVLLARLGGVDRRRCPRWPRRSS